MKYLIPLLFLCSCSSLSSLLKEAPRPSLCNIFEEDKKVFLECLDSETDKFFTISGLEAHNYLALSFDDYLELITWVKKAEVILEEASFAPDTNKALDFFRKTRERLEEMVSELQARNGHKKN